MRIALLLLSTLFLSQSALFGDQKPNVLFISVDDLNDWIEPLGGHPQARTPNFNRLASEAVTFTHNYCPSPGCNPSRSAVMTGYHPATTGMYSNYQDWRKAIPEAITLGQYFRKNGYYSAGAGKIFHYSQVDLKGWDDYFPSIEDPMPEQHYPSPEETINMPKFKGMYGDFDWAPLSLSDEETADAKSVAWISDQLHTEHDKPFFLACGIYRPHLPWYVPQKYFDLYPLDKVQLPKLLEDDQKDLSQRALDIVERGNDYHANVIAAGQWKKAVQGYLASISYADAMLGNLLDALAKSPYSDNTIIILWSDHGWQLGEKKHWRKFAMWENVARCPLMIRDLEGSSAGEKCHRITSLIDIYPTLIDLCGLPPRQDLDGHSLKPLLDNPASEWDYPAITSNDVEEFSIRTEKWRYIRYIDDSEELYNHTQDPEEWHNLAGEEKFVEIKAQLAARLPENPAPCLEETLIELSPHHVRPYLTKKEYQERKATKVKGKTPLSEK